MKPNQTITRGKVKKTEGQIKKHRSQMSNEEVEFLTHRVKEVSGFYELHPHLLNSKRLFKLLTMERLLHTPNLEDCIIEYNQRGADKRVLLRSTFTTHVLLEKKGVSKMTDAHLCLVIDIYTGIIITAYWNEADDHHDNLDMRRYNGDLIICS